ncbi:MAG: D-alanyl-D-alanine carboxypeptidase [Clostridiales bacterium]|nr:D-alanyl-D-alanine carboxypeptidase [Clostridiales bacterium]
MKRIITLLLSVTLALCSFGTRANAEVAEFVLNYDVSAAMLVEYETGEVLYSHNETKRVPIASITKIMTLILAFEAIESGAMSYSDVITISENASAMGGSGVFLHTGEQVSVEDLFKAIIVASANDACVAMAETVAGSQSQFVVLMNNKAKQLGMTDTNFVNCHGLPDTGYYSCARDVATMSRELMRHEDYFKWSSIWLDTMDSIRNKTIITNTNKLVRFYNGCDGTKTGFTNDAMHCVSASAKRNGVRYIAIVLGAKSSQERFDLARELLNYGFANYKTVTVVKKGQQFDGASNLKVSLGNIDTINGLAAQDVIRVAEMAARVDYTVTSVPDQFITAPINEGDVIGHFIVYANGKEIAKIDMLASCAVSKLAYGDYLSKMMGIWLYFNGNNG